jgi:hypothetical protein
MAGSVAGCCRRCWRCSGALPRQDCTPVCGPGGSRRGVALAPAGEGSVAVPLHDRTEGSDSKSLQSSCELSPTLKSPCLSNLQ